MQYSNPLTTVPPANSFRTQPSVPLPSNSRSDQRRLSAVQSRNVQQPQVVYSDPNFLFRASVSTQRFLSSQPLLLRSHSAPLHHNYSSVSMSAHINNATPFANINRVEELSSPDMEAITSEFNKGNISELISSIKFGVVSEKAYLPLQNLCEQNLSDNNFQLWKVIKDARESFQLKRITTLLNQRQYEKLAIEISNGSISRENCLAIKIECLKNSNVIQNVWLKSQIEQYLSANPLQ